VQGQVFGIFSDMDALDYLTVASLKYGDTSYDCNYLWPFNIALVSVASSDAIFVAADYNRIVKWDGRSGIDVIWSKNIELPLYMLADDKGVFGVKKDKSTFYRLSTKDGSLLEQGTFPARIAASPVKLGQGRILVMLEGMFVVLDDKLDIVASFKADWLGDGALTIYEDGFLFILSGGVLAKLAL
jgi:hypothetical protein